MLIDRDGLTEAGLEWAYRWVTHPRQVIESTAVLYEMRERLVARLLAAMSAESGMPSSHWTDRELVDVPDDAGGLDP